MQENAGPRMCELVRHTEVRRSSLPGLEAADQNSKCEQTDTHRRHLSTAEQEGQAEGFLRLRHVCAPSRLRRARELTADILPWAHQAVPFP